MARSEGALAIPMIVHVDDCSLIEESSARVDEETSTLDCFLSILGVFLKLVKHRPANQRQFVIGFWWNSITRARSLDELKVWEYLSMLSEFASRRSLLRRDIQQVSLCGRLHGACLTFPPGAACLMSSPCFIPLWLARTYSLPRLLQYAL